MCCAQNVYNINTDHNVVVLSIPEFIVFDQVRKIDMIF